MNELTIFNYEQVEVRTVLIDNEPWWVLKDVCEVLGLKNSRMIADRLDDDEKGVSQIYTLGGNQEMAIINESGLYNVIIRSDKPNAKKFRKWITSEVLPSIRKHGAYMTEATIDKVLADPDFGIKLLTQLKEEKAKNQVLAAENDKQAQLIGELQPKADYVDYILSSTGTMTSGQIAADYGMSASKLNKILKEERIHRKVNDQWILYREHMNMGYTKSDTIPITRSDGMPDTKMFTKWTQRGRLMINDVLNRRGVYANMDLIQPA